MIAPRVLQVLQIGTTWYPQDHSSGGIRRYYRGLLDSLPRASCSVHGLVLGSPSVSDDTGGLVESFGLVSDPILNRCLRVRRSYRRALTKFPADLIAVHFALYALPILDLLERLPLVVHFHGPWADEAFVEGESEVIVRIKRFVERVVYLRGARFIVLSRAFARVLEERYGVGVEKIRVIPGGVDLAQFEVSVSRTEARKRLGWASHRPILLSVRRLAARMGLDVLVRAMVRVRERVPDALLQIAGQGRLRDQLARLIRELDLDQHVSLLGYVPEELLPMAYCAADLTVVPSLAHEGFGLTIVESLAVGTPVLGTRVGGIAEILEPFSPGLLTDGSEACDPRQLGDVIVQCLSGQRKLPTAIECRRYVNRFSWSLIGPQIAAVYREATCE